MVFVVCYCRLSDFIIFPFSNSFYQFCFPSTECAQHIVTYPMYSCMYWCRTTCAPCSHIRLFRCVPFFFCSVVSHHHRLRYRYSTNKQIHRNKLIIRWIHKYSGRTWKKRRERERREKEFNVYSECGNIVFYTSQRSRNQAAMQMCYTRENIETRNRKKDEEKNQQQHQLEQRQFV